MLRGLLTSVVGPECDRLAQDMDHRCLDHSKWFQAVERVRAELRGERDRDPEAETDRDPEAEGPAETVKQCLALMANYQSGGEDASDLLDLVKDWVAAEAVLSKSSVAGEYEGADGLEDVVKWLVARAEAAATQWRCFHCGEVFTHKECARLHFGSSGRHEPGCAMKVEDSELGLLRRVRELEQQLVPYLHESTAVENFLRGEQSRHAQALRHEEERGYNKGVSECGKVFTEMQAERDAALSELKELKELHERFAHLLP
jgi:hypothetical protein